LLDVHSIEKKIILWYDSSCRDVSMKKNCREVIKNAGAEIEL